MITTKKVWQEKDTGITDGKVIVSVGYSAKEELPPNLKFIILRQRPGGGWKMIKKTKAAQTKGVFLDDVTGMGPDRYRYAVAVVAGRVHSEYESSAITVDFP